MPLGVSSRTPSVLVVRSDAPYRSFAELIDYAKKNPGQVRVGHPGVGSVGEFCILLSMRSPAWSWCRCPTPAPGRP
jgi:tripartite-type tricarboxylate transporter receptor subunit TctC